MDSTAPLISILSLPIGNDEDISRRGLFALEKADLLIGEESKFLSSFLKRLGLSRKFRLFNEHSSEEDLEELLRDMEATKHTCIVSDAGLPNLEDPGRRLIPAILDKRDNLRKSGKHWYVEYLPGASCLDAGLALAGFPTRPFVFLGLLPRDPAERKKDLRKYCGLNITLAILETPYRYKALLQDLVETLGKNSPRRIFLGLHLTHPVEEFQFRGKGKDLLGLLSDLPKAPPIILVEGLVS